MLNWFFHLTYFYQWAKLSYSSLTSNYFQCPWFDLHAVDWIYQTPTLVVLVLNLGFLICIMWVLITKLRSTNTVEKQQYQKAAKALLVLMPLLGITHVITIYGPVGDRTTINIYECTRAVLLSTQVSVCFIRLEIIYQPVTNRAHWTFRATHTKTRNFEGSGSLFFAFFQKFQFNNSFKFKVEIAIAAAEYGTPCISLLFASLKIFSPNPLIFPISRGKINKWIKEGMEEVRKTKKIEF